MTELQARVAWSYERLGLPTWVDPHPAMASPRDEEYSRLTDAARYRIVHPRARAWATTLADALGVRLEVLKPAPATDAGAEPFDRGVRLVPRHSDALPLLLFERDVPTQPDEGTLAVLTIAVARPDIVVKRNRTAAVTPAIRARVTCWEPSTRRSVMSWAGRVWCCVAAGGMPSGIRAAGALAGPDRVSAF